ncbi:MAG TPA: hypothetical protein VEU11_14235 [Terriglobales bacterium]|nr:hypothetical protein [Terriglobales bacterium]
MQIQRRRFTLMLAALTVLLSPGVHAQTQPKFHVAKPKPKLGSAPAVIWREPTDIKMRDLYWGPGGEEHAPKGSLTFVEEKLNGVNPKFDARDSDGIKWGIKFGREAKPEVAATRLVWAVGYFTNEDYYVAQLPTKGMRSLSRGEQYISHETIQGARLKRHNKGEEEIADWSWDKNPFVGTKELSGLKIMMEIICNTDLKSANQHVYDIHGTEQRYIAADIGAAFGKAGLTFGRTKGILRDYQALPLIKTIGPDYVDFWHFKHIPKADAKWIGGYLAQLSDAQISDVFRAAGFSDEEVQGFTKKVRDKIDELNCL